MVHRRSIRGEALVLGNQGALYGNAMTWWDHGTGSIWSQPLGEAIMGPLRGERLDLLPSTLSSWHSWRESHPETLALDAPNGDIGRSLDDLMIVVELGGEALALPIEDVRRSGVANATVGDTPIAVVAPAGTDDWRVFARRLDERVVRLDLSSGSLFSVEDPADCWDHETGLSPDGGESLKPLPAFTVFPDDYRTFFPEGATWDSGD